MKKTVIIIFLLYANIFCNQSKTQTTMDREQQLKILMQMAKAQAATYKNYATKPMYYLQINKSACRLIVKVNDIPLSYYFTEDGGQSMLYPINNRIFSSGRQTFSINVSPVSSKEFLMKEAHVNVKLVYLREEFLPLVPDAKILTELNLPVDIETRHAALYTDSAAFDAKVPYDYSSVLKNAADLTKIRDLETEVVRRYNETRQYYVNCDAVAYFKDLRYTYPGGDMEYLTEKYLIPIYRDMLDEGFNPDLIDRNVFKIENYEMVICGHGKLVLLQDKKTHDNILKMSYFKSKADKERNHANYWTFWEFIALFMPKGSDKLERFY